MVSSVARARALPWEAFSRKRRGLGTGFGAVLGAQRVRFELEGIGIAGRWLGLDYATVSAAIKRVRRRAESERKLMKLIERVSANLKFEN